MTRNSRTHRADGDAADLRRLGEYEQARILAARMRGEGGNVRERIAAGLRTVLQREAREEELDHLVALHADLRAGSGLSEEQALDRVALLALNLNEFIYLD